MTSPTPPSPPNPSPAPPKPQDKPPAKSKTKWLLGLGAAGLLVLFIGLVIFLLQPSTPTARIRDIFLIFLALEVFLIGIGLLVLVVQLAVLINLIQNEIRPILESTQQTVQTVRGTTQFLSDHLVEPVLKLNEYLVVLLQIGSLFRHIRKPSQKGE